MLKEKHAARLNDDEIRRMTRSVWKESAIYATKVIVGMAVLITFLFLTFLL